MFTRSQIENYHCPRWNEWPNLDLYMDQVISLLEENLQLFYTESSGKPVTATMINNYVKQKIIVPSTKKKYQREHLAYLYVIFLLKPVISLADICDGVNYLQSLKTPEEAYNLFCDEIEDALALAFTGGVSVKKHSGKGMEIIHSIALAFAYTFLTRFYIANDKAANNPPESPQK